MNDRKNAKIQIRLSEEELQLFKDKSASYGGNISEMIRDAVAHFDDVKTKGKIDAMIALLKFYKEYQQRLSWLGGNFNQAMHRANELAIAGELSPQYLQKVIMPKTNEAIKFLRAIKSELESIHDILER